MSCLTAAEMDSLVRGATEPENASRLRQHIADCPTCRERLSACESNEEMLEEVKRLPGHWLEGDSSGGASSLAGARRSLGGQHPAAPGELLPEGFAGYRVVQRIHQGGQGLVYRALQVGTGREVAIKVLREGPFADPEDRSRFEREIRLLASIRHPHIVTVHDSGTVGGNCYFVMDYVPGERLDAYAARIGRPIRQLVELFVKICEAVNAAHLQGIIHRDLKPGNILIDQDGLPRILDFGLAKEATAEIPDPLDAQSMTATGQFLGSLPWASPEQAEGHPLRVDIRTDVYSLGVMFYHALTAHFPYEVTGHMRAILDRIVRADAIRPRTRRAEIDDELETILLKCLSKDRDRRYQTAGELAQDLRRYLAGEPIQAKHDSPLYVARKMLRRHRVPVAVAATFVVLVTASTVALALLYRSARTSATLAEQRRLVAVQAQDLAGRNEQTAISEKQKAEHVWYRALIALAARHIDEKSYRPARQSLEGCSPRCRNWEWGWLQHLTQLEEMTVWAHEGGVRCVDFSPDGLLFATAGADKTVKLWDTASGTLRCTLAGHTMTVHTVVFSRDGQMLATSGDDHYVGVWRVATGERLLWFEASTCEAVTTVAFDAEGTRLVTGSGSYWADPPHDYSVRIWSARDGRKLAEFYGFDGAVYAVAFSPDGNWVAAGSSDGTVHLVDLVTAQSLVLDQASPTAVWSLAFSPDGQWLAVAYGRGHIMHGEQPDNRVQVWDWRNRELVRTLEHGHKTPENTVHSVRFSPDGTGLVTAGADRVARTWELGSGQEIAQYRGHEQAVMCAAFSPSGDRVITASADHTVRFWTLAAPDPFITLSHAAAVMAVAFSPDGRRLATVSSGSLVLWDTTAAEIIGQRAAHGASILSVRFNEDGSRLATAGQDQTVRVFDAFTLEEELVIPTPGCRHLAYAGLSPDGERLAAISDGNAIRILDAHTGQLIRMLSTDPNCILGLDYAHANPWLAVAKGQTVQIWDAKTGVQLHEIPSPPMGVARRVAFSPDDSYLAGAGLGGQCTLWDTQTGRQLMSLEAETRAIHTLAFSPDGSRLILGGDNQAIKIYETRTGIELLTLKGPLSVVQCATFSPDGRTIATADTAGHVLLWPALPW